MKKKKPKEPKGDIPPHFGFGILKTEVNFFCPVCFKQLGGGFTLVKLDDGADAIYCPFCSSVTPYTADQVLT